MLSLISASFMIFPFEAHSATCLRIAFLSWQVGSDSAQGAGAPTMFQAIRRIVDSLSNGRSSENTYERAIRQSFLGMFFAISGRILWVFISFRHHTYICGEEKIDMDIYIYI